jgi:hypothetical protein
VPLRASGAPEPSSTPCQLGGTGVGCCCSVVLRPLFPRSGSAVFTLMFVSLCRGRLSTLAGCVPDCVSTLLPRLILFCRHEMHLGWCNCDSFLSVINSAPLRNCFDSPIYCAVEIVPQEIVFSLLTPAIPPAKVSSTCAAVPSGSPRPFASSSLSVVRRQAAESQGEVRTYQPTARDAVRNPERFPGGARAASADWA